MLVKTKTQTPDSYKRVFMLHNDLFDAEPSLDVKITGRCEKNMRRLCIIALDNCLSKRRNFRS